MWRTTEAPDDRATRPKQRDDPPLIEPDSAAVGVNIDDAAVALADDPLTHRAPRHRPASSGSAGLPSMSTSLHLEHRRDLRLSLGVGAGRPIHGKFCTLARGGGAHRRADIR